MKQDQYFRMKSSLMADDCIIHLIEQEHISGFGIYIALLLELRLRDNYRISRMSLPALARRWNVTIEELERVVDGYKLFEPTEDGGEPSFGSPYLDGMMVELEAKWRAQSTAGKRRAQTARRTEKGSFTSSHQPIEKNRIEKNTVVVDGADEKPENCSNEFHPYHGWEAYVDEAFGEQSWVEAQAMHSGMGQQFLEQLPRVVAYFKRHVVTYGKESAILSVADAKSYFGNFIRQGTPMQRELQALLNKQISQLNAENPYRYEQRDAETDERSYCGMPIPKTAPPRPHENAVWSETLRQWA